MDNENQAGEEKKLSRDQRKILAFEKKIADLAALRGLECDDITGYVYRLGANKRRYALPQTEEILTDNDIGEMYGPGSYEVTYHLNLEDGTVKHSTYAYNVDREYAEIHRNYCLLNGKKCYLDSPNELNKTPFNLAEMFSKEKIESIVLLVGALKTIMGEKGGGGELAMMREVMSENTKLMAAALSPKQNFSDSLVTEAFKQLSHRKEEIKVEPMEQMRAQLEFFRDLGMVPAGQSNQDNENMGTVDKLIEKAIEFLPGLLQANNGNIPAAAAAAKKSNPLVSMYLKNKDAQKAMYMALIRDYGKDAADQWARGFNIDPSKFSAIEIQVKTQNNGVMRL